VGAQRRGYYETNRDAINAGRRAAAKLKRESSK